MPTDLAALWDFSDPAASEARFAALLPTASPQDALILRTQIARSHGIRRDFARATAELQRLAPLLPTACPEGLVRYHLELGRALCSATHPPDAQTAQTRAAARAHSQRALDLARSACLDALAIDAIHMMAFAQPDPADQLASARRALDLCLASSQPDARRWEASLRNNIGFALHALAHHDQALAEFERARELRRTMGNPANERAARWAVAWTLRALGRADESLLIQLQLDKECTAIGQPSPHVCEELALLYESRGDPNAAAHYRARLSDLTRPTP